MRTSRIRLLAVTAVLPVALAACGDGSDSSSSGSSGSSGSGSSSSAASPLSVQPSQVAPISAVKVNGAGSSKPSMSLGKKPFQVNETTTKVTKQGTGKTVGAKDIAYTSYVATNGTSGKTIESTFGKASAAFNLGDKSVFPGLAKALKGKKVGTEMVVAVPPADGFGGQGNKQVGVSGKDTLVFYVKVNDSAPLLKQATGEKVTPPDDLPQVTVPNKPNAQATITPRKGEDPPTELVKQDLIRGEGPTVKKGQTILASYTGATFKDGKVFDSSAKQGQPASFPIGADQVIKAWDQGLVGKKVGSRVLLVAPASFGYGKQGQKDQQGKQVIPPNAPLVFVVDILAAV